MRILAIGIATLDIINLVAEYPVEDQEVRALSQRRVRGGNATNSLVVLGQLGHRCGWGGVIAEGQDSQFIESDLRRHGVDTSACVIHRGAQVPRSYVVLSRANGSRSIVHYRETREFGARDFEKIDLNSWDWVHFEGRNVAETAQMLAYLKRRDPRLICSLEVEKPRTGIEALFNLPDVLLFSRAYANARGFFNGTEFLRSLNMQTPAATLFCAWGEQGGFAVDAAGQAYQSPAFAPPDIVDTLGAGDVFNAGIIDRLARGGTPRQALEDACRLAGRKCGQLGFDGLVGR